MTIVNSSMIAVQSISRTVRFMTPNAHASLRAQTKKSSGSVSVSSHLSMKSVDDVVKATILSPQYFPTFLGCSMAFSFVGGYMYMESLRQSHLLQSSSSSSPSLSRHHTTPYHHHHHHTYDAATSETTTLYTTPLRMLYE
mmetsp:Transcript_34277/g.82557  ORF Transcript_34277/g.82557 Transcript_34277/m.82557 type:complete len:140 (+) Transcript_34277:170-589(+)|eukprot:CAMPEP_0113483320 /NCGR_PEP_ID=MMETSP0014_2-20120614/23373_1 /TAXON_ID=2857 /ORGANISM="Nitzschia sp." /LENGTH=139 /DNA_ID=CAMNT_0000376863 /DNA_START=88 /DNA_END=507 /DNA_ORIENTATION=+ /assembly_acc=CAM_ASM_000159